MRPRGDIAQALLGAWEQPRTVAQAAEHAQVGYSAARYTASRLMDRGELRVATPGRPAVLVAASAPYPLAAAEPRQVLPMHTASTPVPAPLPVLSFWERPAGAVELEVEAEG